MSQNDTVRSLPDIVLGVSDVITLFTTGDCCYALQLFAGTEGVTPLWCTPATALQLQARQDSVP
jgi:hypothetical protein